MSCHNARSVHGNKSLSPVQHPWAELQNATGALHRHPGTSESSGAKVVTHKSLPTSLILRSTRLLRCDTGRHLCRHRRHIFIAACDPPWCSPSCIPLLHVPCAPCCVCHGCHPLGVVDVCCALSVSGNLWVGDRSSELYSAGRKVLCQTPQVWEGASCDAECWCSVPSRFHLRQPVPDPTFTVGSAFQLGTAPHFFVFILSSFISLSLRPFLYFLGFIFLRSSAVALELSLLVLLSNHRDCRAEVVMFTRFLIPHFDV